MAADLTFGSVPPFYREIYDIVCPNQEQVDRDMFINLLVKSSLPKQTLMQIWDLVDNKQGYLSRTGLYKALALTAMAQQGKAISEKLLETYSDQELPKPQLGDLTDLKAIGMRVRREKNPNVLGYNYKELCLLDTIKVERVPEKKGIIMKHVEYEVTSQKFKVTVLRRYNDFLALHELLLLRFPYRMIPRLPPKKMMGASREFIEHRRKCLRRYLNLVARHPVMGDDKLMRFFLTYNGSEMQHKIKEHFKGIPDEFMTSELASKAKDIVPMDTQVQLSHSKQHIYLLYSSVNKLIDVTERMVLRSTQEAGDMLHFGKELSALSSDDTPVSPWATGTNDTWSHLKKGFKHLSVEFATLADKATSQASVIQDSVVGQLYMYFDLLSAFKDLCERHEKGVLQDHQRAIQKMGQYKKKKMTATVQGSESEAVEQLEARILEQESQISNMENRNYFSLHCLQMEVQLIHANMETLFIVIEAMINNEAKGCSEIAAVWEQIKPIVNNIFPKEHNVNGGVPTSPIGSPNSGRAGITVQ
ncbi:sorting nexin-8-like isoform X2 [Lingula anatina]|uniref:Sorting nexin-8-like isoform X2 n=1 Tax=Lingula anatina TaxID=7574 RepID=A0A1S3I2F4_LINAN|nr:sorting nexin-8-like isoform X2 [Lingula anatina]|eukprot:XP_013391524.1 sorting nexin-8-like isoform X2 [Lingula anatina]